MEPEGEESCFSLNLSVFTMSVSKGMALVTFIGSHFIEDCLKLALSSLLCPRSSTEVTEEVPIPAAVPRPGSPVLVGLQVEVGQVCRYAALASRALVYPFRFLRWKNN